MNPYAIRLALIIAAVGAAAFVAFMVFAVLLYGCRAEMPPEPPFTMTVTVRDAARSTD